MMRTRKHQGLCLLCLACLLVACDGQTPSNPTPTAVAVMQPTSAPPTATRAPATATTAPTAIAPTATAMPRPTQAQATATPPAAQATPTANTSSAIALPAPRCNGSLRPTLEQTEGPYYKANTPKRASLLEAGITGTKLVVTGYVLTSDCKPVANAWLDFWQADANGAYDNSGYKLRGHQFADTAGRYTLETVWPGLYPGRTRHIHVKVQAPNQAILTTQIYFPNEPANQRDGIFDSALLTSVLQDTNAGRVVTFNFVVKP